MGRKSDFLRKRVETLPDVDDDLAKLSDEDIKKLEKLRDVILRFPSYLRQPSDILKKAVEELGISVSTFYRKRAKFESNETLSSLISKPGSGGRGRRRIPVQSEKIIHQTLKQLETESRQVLVSQVIREVERRCRNAETLVPSKNTIRSIVNEHPLFDRAKRRFGARYAKVEYDSHGEVTPPMSAPLERIQIDHTLVDIVIADSIYRLPLGRPWITMAIDEYTRAILGFTLSFASPSATTNAYCMTRVVLPKKNWLQSINVNFDWPMQGLPYHVYVDNGMDLKANALVWGCLEHGIAQPEHRAPGYPHTGAYIERALGTFMSEMRLCSSNTTREWMKKKVTFDPGERAEMTLIDLERYLVTKIAGVYHNEQKEDLDWQTPKNRWINHFAGIDLLGNQTDIIVPQPRMPLEPNRFILDFLPREWRTIRNSRVRLHRMSYWSETLRHIIRSNDARKYEFRWSHQDISFIYWKDPRSGQFVPIQNRHGHKGPIEFSMWKLAGQRLRDLGKDPNDEAERFRALDELDEIRRSASRSQKNTKPARAHRKAKENEQALPPIIVNEKPSNKETPILEDDFVPNRRSQIRTDR